MVSWLLAFEGVVAGVYRRA